MGFFSDFLIAERDEADAIAAHEDPTERWPGLAVKNVSSLDMANLLAILTEDPIDLELEVVHEPMEEGEPMVSVLSPRLIAALVRVEDRELSVVGSRWAECEEFRGWFTPDDLEHVLRDVRELARRAVALGQPILMCETGC